MSLFIDTDNNYEEDNTIQIFESNLNNFDNTKIYVTIDAIGYFISIKNILENIVMDLAILETGGTSTPQSLQLEFNIDNNIDRIEEFLKIANKNNVECSTKVIGIKNILIKFDIIKKLILFGNKNIRQDAVELFIKTESLYQYSQVQEFVNLLNENELEYIMQLVNQEKTLIEKSITKSLLHSLTIQRINQINTLRTANNDISSDEIKEESSLKMETNGDRVLKYIMSNKDSKYDETDTNWSDSWVE